MLQSTCLELLLPDPLKEARNRFLGEVVDIRENVIIRHGGELDENSEYQGPHVAAVNDLTARFLYLLDGGEMDNAGYTVLPNQMVKDGTTGLMPNIAGELGATYESFFRDIND